MAVVAVLLFGCGADEPPPIPETCAPGREVACPCGGGHMGVQTYGSDGQLGPCDCSQASKPAEPSPPPPPPVEPVPTATDSSDALREAWLTARLRGHDNSVASLRRVTITERDGGYQVLIVNQFRFRCGLEFGDDGRPAKLLRCRSGEPDWSVAPAEIPLECEERNREEICHGPYTLMARGGYRSRAHFQLRRPL
ncbi:MAG: hypothetical protein AAGF12_36750 [Myxococcota bacterium]